MLNELSEGLVKNPVIVDLVALACKDGDGKLVEKSHSDQEYLRSLTMAVSDMPIEQWKALPGPLKDYSNKTAQALNKNEPIPFPPGFDPPIQNGADAPATEAAPAASAPAARPKREGPSKVAEARKFIVNNPELTKVQCKEKIAELGLDIAPATLGALYYEAHKVMGLLVENGKLPAYKAV